MRHGRLRACAPERAPAPCAGGSWLDKALGRQPLSGRFERLFVEFRMLRKRALQATIDKLRATLEAAKTEL